MKGYVYKEIDGKKFIAADESGRPLVVEEGEALDKAIGVDAIHLLEKIPTLQLEAKRHREAKEEAEAKLNRYGDIDAKTAKEMAETMQNIDITKMVDAGKVDQAKKEIKEKYEAQIAKLQEDHAKLMENSRSAKVEAAFASSQYVKEKLTFPTPKVCEKVFGGNFYIEDDKLFARWEDGTDILSTSNPIERATFDEAIKILVEKHPERDSYLKATDKHGSGYSSGNRSGAIPEEVRRNMSPAEKLDYARSLNN